MADETVHVTATDDRAIFNDVAFTVIPNERLDPARVDDLVQTMERSGARYIPLRDKDREVVSIEMLSHILSVDIEFPKYARALELGVHIVTPSWAWTCIEKKRKVSERQYNPDPAQIFRDVVVCCAGLPDGDQEAITAGVIALGGLSSQRLTRLVTHIVTTDFDHELCVMADKKSHPAIKVLPHWFHDCFRLGKKIREKPYALPEAEISRFNVERTVKIMPSPYLKDATNPSPASFLKDMPQPSPSVTRKNLNAFMSKQVFLSEDLNLSTEFIRSIERLINHSGGVLTAAVDSADIYIGQYREGDAYVAASQAGKEVASLPWLFHVINRNKYVSPLRKLFHYPLPRHGISGFEELKISLSNYAGEARAYVENLITSCGAEYTKTMKQDNTHLITAHKHGEKCDAAQEWHIEVVNHLWLEESFAKCAMQKMSNPRYTTFPVMTNLGEVTGTTSLDIKSVEREYFAKAHSPQKWSSAKPSGAKVARTSDTTSKRNSATTLVKPGKCYDDEVASVRQGAIDHPEQSSLLETPRIAHKHHSPPAVNSTGRASKLKALDTLHSQAPDILSFQKEMKRKGGVTHGGRRSNDNDEAPNVPIPTSRKRPSDEYDITDEGSNMSDGEAQGAKQTKKVKRASSSALPPIRYRMLVTGDNRWSGNARKESTDKQTLRSLGVLLTQDCKGVDILVAPKIMRTKKFVAALACCPLVVDTTYLDYILKKKDVLDDPPMLQDPENEKRFGFVLAEALERAKHNERKLFRGWDIFITKDVVWGFDTYNEIIQINGGTAMLYQGRVGLQASKRATSLAGPDTSSVVYLVSGTTPTEIKIWKKFRQEMEKQNLEARIVATDWVLNSAMSQTVLPDDEWLLDDTA